MPQHGGQPPADGEEGLIRMRVCDEHLADLRADGELGSAPPLDRRRREDLEGDPLADEDRYAGAQLLDEMIDVGAHMHLPPHVGQAGAVGRGRRPPTAARDAPRRVEQRSEIHERALVM
jgi:hypothetical protein